MSHSKKVCHQFTAMFCTDSKCTMQSLAFISAVLLRSGIWLKSFKGATLFVWKNLKTSHRNKPSLSSSQCNNYSTAVLSVEDKYLMTFDRHFRLYLFYPYLWFRLSSSLSCFITKEEKLPPGRFAGSKKAFSLLAPDLIAVATGGIALPDFFT